MDIRAVVLALTFSLCKIQAQICGCGGPSTSTKAPISNALPVGAVPQITVPSVGTTITDNSLSTSLANVLQLLVVSDLIESTLNTAFGLHALPSVNTPTVCEPVAPAPIFYTPTVEVIKPVTEYIPAPCAPVVDYITPCGPSLDLTPSCGPVIDYIPPRGPNFDFVVPCGPTFDLTPPCVPNFDFVPCGPTFDLISPCGPKFDFVPYGPTFNLIPPSGSNLDFVVPYGPTFDIIPPCEQVIEYIPTCGPTVPSCGPTVPSCGPTVPSCGSTVPPCGPTVSPCGPTVPSCGPVIPPYGPIVPPCSPNIETIPNFYGGITEITIPITNYGAITEFFSPGPNIVPICSQSFSPNMIGGLQEIIAPIQVAPLVSNYYSGFTEICGPAGNIAPLAAEILIPSAIPAQLTCSIGSIPTSLPCVSVNVEPLPCGCGLGNNIMPNTCFY